MASSIPQARAGTLYLMMGGDKKTFNKVKPVLTKLSDEGKLLRYIGTAGKAAQVKALVNMVMNINTAGLAEGLAARPDNSPMLESMLEWLRTSARFLAEGNPITRMRGFLVGLVDTFNIVYFLAFTVVCLAVATRSLGLRRWP